MTALTRNETLGAQRHGRFPKLAGYIQQHAIRHGHFELASGQKTDVYCDGKQVTLRGEGALLVAEAAISVLEDVEFSAVGGMELGAVPIVEALTIRYAQMKRDVPTFIVRKESKSHGTRKRIEGPLPDAGAKVVIFDDVVTTGGSIIEAIHAARDQNLDVVLAISMVDRNAGGADKVEAEGVKYVPLVDFREMGFVE